MCVKEREKVYVRETICVCVCVKEKEAVCMYENVLVCEIIFLMNNVILVQTFSKLND